jgi:hypothetical protein
MNRLSVRATARVKGISFILFGSTTKRLRRAAELGRDALHAVVRRSAQPDRISPELGRVNGVRFRQTVKSQAGMSWVYTSNPFAASRYRDRHQVSGAKSDPADGCIGFE